MVHASIDNKFVEELFNAVHKFTSGVSLLIAKDKRSEKYQGHPITMTQYTSSNIRPLFDYHDQWVLHQLVAVV